MMAPVQAGAVVFVQGEEGDGIGEGISHLNTVIPDEGKELPIFRRVKDCV
jgi:hypothetical protein